MRDKERLEKLEMTTIAQMEMHIQRLIAEKETLQERIDQMNSQLSAENLGHLSTMLADLIPLSKLISVSGSTKLLEPPKSSYRSLLLPKMRFRIVSYRNVFPPEVGCYRKISDILGGVSWTQAQNNEK